MYNKEIVMKNTKLTSVNVNKNNHKEFKILSIRENITFQKLVNIVLEKYVKDNKFRNMINEEK
tara:strand:- start:21442 stop:21630 length:189 start_codon:yes stop_codon:yes gene_type:complete